VRCTTLIMHFPYGRHFNTSSLARALDLKCMLALVTSILIVLLGH